MEDTLDWREEPYSTRSQRSITDREVRKNIALIDTAQEDDQIVVIGQPALLKRISDWHYPVSQTYGDDSIEDTQEFDLDLDLFMEIEPILARVDKARKYLKDELKSLTRPSMASSSLLPLLYERSFQLNQNMWKAFEKQAEAARKLRQQRSEKAKKNKVNLAKSSFTTVTNSITAQDQALVSELRDELKVARRTQAQHRQQAHDLALENERLELANNGLLTNVQKLEQMQYEPQALMKCDHQEQLDELIALRDKYDASQQEVEGLTHDLTSLRDTIAQFRNNHGTSHDQKSCKEREAKYRAELDKRRAQIISLEAQIFDLRLTGGL